MKRIVRGGNNYGPVTRYEKNSEGQYVKPTAAPPPPPFILSDFLFDKQLKFVEDPRPFKVAVCSRRSGKTVACAADLIQTAISSADVVCLYITLSRNNAKKILWPELQKINRTFKLGGVEDMTELSMRFANGSIIYASGAKDETEIEKFRGLALKKVYIDECQSFRAYIKELIDDVITPALMDHAGTLCLIGTPGPIPAGYFAEVSGAVPSKLAVAAQWSNHAWTFFDNPHIVIKSKMTHQQSLDRVLKMRGVGLNDPSIQREFFGRWVLDSESLWIQYKRELNDFTELQPGKKYNYALGIDIGYNDADALAVIAWEDHSDVIYLVDEVVTAKQDLTDLVESVKLIQKRYDISKMIIDSGGLGKKLAEEMRRRHQLPVQDADKARKQENVAFLNAALRTGRFKAKAGSRFAQDSFLVEIDRDKSSPDKIKLSGKYHSDIIDAVLYAFKESPAYAWRAEPNKPKRGTKEWAEAQVDEMWEAAQDHFVAQAEVQKRIDSGGYSDD